MNETIKYYNQNAEEFVSGTVNADMALTRDRFLKWLPNGASILDAGCGSGRDARVFKDKGYIVDAFDASEELCRLAHEYTGIDVKCIRFEDLEGEGFYDGIWACASLLHVKRDDLPGVLHKLHLLLRKNGVIYASFKYGQTERFTQGRYFNDMDEQLLEALLSKEDLKILDLFVTRDVRPGRSSERWINVIAKDVVVPV